MVLKNEEIRIGEKIMTKKENLKEVEFAPYDSWALWHVPSDIDEAKTDDERQRLFGESYQPKSFPSEQLSEDLETQLSLVRYVLVGLNPGNEGESLAMEEVNFLNFHGLKKSLDYRLASALYGTEMWGAFMTDLVHIVESDSAKVQTSQTDAQTLEAHLDQLAIPDTAVLVALGGKTYQALAGNTRRQVKTIPHYSGANGHWKATTTRQKVLAITQ